MIVHNNSVIYDQTPPSPIATASLPAVTVIGTIYFLFCAIAVYVNYPGRLTPDSYTMMVEARYSELLSDWHAPIITRLWSLLSPPLAQPTSALVVQSLMIFLYSIQLMLQRGIAILAISLLPLIGLSGLIIKDVFLVAAIIAAVFSIDSLRGRVRWLCFLSSR